MATVLQVITRVRERLDDLADTDPNLWLTDDSDFGWTNEELVALLVEAEIEHTRRIPLIDSTTATDGDSVALTSITLASGTATYAISPKILRIEQAKLASEVTAGRTGKLYKVDRNEALAYKTTDDVCVYELDQHQNSITFHGTPDAVDTVNLVVARLPLTTYTWASNQATELEIREQDHYHLVHWIEHLALLKRDPDAAESPRAGRAAARFAAAVGPQRSHRLEQVAREAGDGPHRTTAVW